MTEAKLSTQELNKIKQMYKSMTNDQLVPISIVPSNVNQDLKLYSDLYLGKYIIKTTKEQSRGQTQTNPNYESDTGQRGHRNVSFNNNVDTRVFTTYGQQQVQQFSPSNPDDTLNLNVSDIHLTSPQSVGNQQGQGQPLNQSMLQDNMQSQFYSESGRNNSWLRFQQNRPGVDRNIELDQRVYEEMFQDAQAKGELEQGVNTPEDFKQCLQSNLTDLQILQVQKEFKRNQMNGNSVTNSLVEVSMQNGEDQTNSMDEDCCSICRTPNAELPSEAQEQEMEMMVLNQCWHQFHTICLVRNLKVNPQTGFACANCRTQMNEVDLNNMREFINKIYGIESIEEFMQ